MTEHFIDNPEVDILPYCHILESQDSDSTDRTQAISELWDLSCRNRMFSQHRPNKHGCFTNN
jgi:hypothetical protein